MVVGQAPGPTAAERPLPYSGASGKTLRDWLHRAGFEDGALYDPNRFYLTSVTKCFPGRATSGNGDRAPSRAEVSLCFDHLSEELRLVMPELILALGRLSITLFLPSMRSKKLAELVGRSYPAELESASNAFVLPLPHPSGVSRWHNDPHNQDVLVAAIGHLSALRSEHGW